MDCDSASTIAKNREEMRSATRTRAPKTNAVVWPAPASRITPGHERAGGVSGSTPGGPPGPNAAAGVGVGSGASA
jgi:hypothetical protein